jgi:hypothetical protein
VPEYGGVHTFHFIPWDNDPDPAMLIQRFLDRYGPPDPEGPLHFAAVMEEGSDFGGFAHFSKDTASETGGLIGDELWELGLRSDIETEGKVYKDGTNFAAGVKRRSPRYVAICRIRVQGRKTLDVIEEVGDRYDGKPPFGGGSQLLRRNQALIELVSDDREELTRLVEDLRSQDYGPMRVGVADAGAKST